MLLVLISFAQVKHFHKYIYIFVYFGSYELHLHKDMIALKIAIIVKKINVLFDKEK